MNDNKVLYDNDKVMEEIINPLVDINLDLHEINLDKFLDDKFIREIPILKTIHSSFRIVNSIHNAIFLKKLWLFIINLPETTKEQREYFIKKYKQDDEKFTERLFEILDKIDDSDKCKLESKIFEKYFYGIIDYGDFISYSHAIQKVEIKVLNDAYIKFHENKVDEEGNIVIPTYIGGAFLNIGMAEIVTYLGLCGYCLNDNAKKFLRCLFE